MGDGLRDEPVRVLIDFKHSFDFDTGVERQLATPMVERA